MFCHWDQSKNDVFLLIIGVGKNWVGPFFPHPSKWKHQPCADGYLGGGKLGLPILVKTSTIPCHEYANNLGFLGGGEKLGRPILSPPRQDKTSILGRSLSGWRKTWLVHFFPTLTSESINLTLSWIHIPILLFRGWGKTGPAHFFPALTSESINLVEKLGYLGGEKLRKPILSPPWLVKASTLLSWIWSNLCFLVGGEKLGRPILSPPRQDKPCVDGFLGGEKLGWSVIFPPWPMKASTLSCHEYTYNLCLLGDGENWAGPFFPHSD